MPLGSAWERRPTLTMWVYDSVLGAAAGRVRLDALVRRGSVNAREAVTVTWVPGAHRPRIDVLRRSSALDTSADSPVLARLVEALIGPSSDADASGSLRALAARLDGTGIDQLLLADMRGALEPGRSALLVFALSAELDAVRAVIERGRARGDVTLLHAYLAADAEPLLRRAFESLD
jgi:uncharacterized membrane protein